MTSGASKVTPLTQRLGRSQRRRDKRHFRTMGMNFQRLYDSSTREVRALAESDGQGLVGRAAPAGRRPLARGSSQAFLPCGADHLNKWEQVEGSGTVIRPNFCINPWLPL